ncbi:MAG: hypothetical protein EBX50_06215 [Chitinophagia bacterium]|nr:hypothetical protein [Chitinophagia bacterium]
MLFAAVSLGFFAENIREHFVEKERAHELIESFMDDVEANIMYTDSLITNTQSMVMKNDSAVFYLMTSNKVNLDSFYALLPITSYRYLSNNETYDQMKSSGSLRYIKDTTLLRKIINYNNASKAAEFRSVTQEFEYTAHEYIEGLQKWMPPSIAIKRQISILKNRKYFQASITKTQDKQMIKSLYEIDTLGSHVVSGAILLEMRKEFVPILTRKIFLMSASQLYMSMAAEQAKDLLSYYHKKIY